MSFDSVIPELDQWHPVCRSRSVGRKPHKLTLYDRDFVLFRTATGRVGAFADGCPHRGMRLSLGRVDGESLVCPYHGWRFDTSGRGNSPGNPRLHVCADVFDATEHRGAIWMKNREATSNLPDLDFPGYYLVHMESSRVEAPVEVLLDNFTEAEHTATAHWQFGYDLAHLHEVKNETTVEADSVLVESSGRQKKISWLAERSLGIKRSDQLEIRWRTFYRPLHAVFDWWWLDPLTGQERSCRFKEISFFHRVNEKQSQLFSYYLWTLDPKANWGVNRGLRLLAQQVVKYEIRIDRWLIENVIDSQSDRPGDRLGRFDRALQEHRKQMKRVAALR